MKQLTLFGKEAAEPIILDISIKTYPSKHTEGEWTISIWGKAHPNVDSGCDFGYCGGSTKEELQKNIDNYLNIQREWFIESYDRPVILNLKYES